MIAANWLEFGVNYTTEIRYIDAFQIALSCRIIERKRSGYGLTIDARIIFDDARAVETTLFNIQRQVERRERRLEADDNNQCIKWMRP